MEALVGAGMGATTPPSRRLCRGSSAGVPVSPGPLWDTPCDGETRGARRVAWGTLPFEHPQGPGQAERPPHPQRFPVCTHRPHRCPGCVSGSRPLCPQVPAGVTAPEPPAQLRVLPGQSCVNRLLAG